MPIIPVNGHLLIEPIARTSFISSGRETYEEIGIVIDNGFEPTNTLVSIYSIEHNSRPEYPANGDKVYFDSWLAAKFPKNDKEWYWLVKYEDVRAIEPYEEQSLPK